MKDVACLTTGDVLDAVPTVSRMTLERLVTQKYITPAQPGAGRKGKWHQWTVMDAVALCIARKVQNSNRGCVDAYLKEVFDAFAALDEGELLKSFEKGCTHLITIHQGRPILAHPQYDWIDVKALYDETTERIKEVSRRLKRLYAGRRRGLVDANLGDDYE